MVRKGQVMQTSESQQPAAMGSSQQLPSTLNIKILDGHRAGEAVRRYQSVFRELLPQFIMSLRNVS